MINANGAERSKSFPTALNTNNRVTGPNILGLYVFTCFLYEQDGPFIFHTLKHTYKYLLHAFIIN